jgi:hypothetical protein
MMKKTAIISTVSIVVLLLIGFSSVSYAQLRSEVKNSSELMGPIVKQNDPSKGADLGNLFNMQMDHSYSMMFSSFGGQFQNMNAYTNTMRFFFSENLTGRVDLSLLHSPFGNSMMSPNANNGMDTRFLIRNAELNYQINDRSNIRIQFQQVPGYGYGMSPWSSRMRRYDPYNPFGSPFHDRNF